MYDYSMPFLSFHVQRLKILTSVLIIALTSNKECDLHKIKLGKTMNSGFSNLVLISPKTSFIVLATILNEGHCIQTPINGKVILTITIIKKKYIYMIFIFSSLFSKPRRLILLYR